MSWREVLHTVEALLRDPHVGLAHHAELLEATVATPVRTDFEFIDWAIVGVELPTRKPTVLLRPLRMQQDTRYRAGRRDGQSIIEILFETHGAEPQHVRGEVVVVADAVMHCMDHLREFSDQTGGTVVDIAPPMLFERHQPASPTQGGFLATITIQERSSDA